MVGKFDHYINFTFKPVNALRRKETKTEDTNFCSFCCDENQADDATYSFVPHYFQAKL